MFKFKYFKMEKSELDQLITSFTAPMPNQKVILTDYEAKQKLKHEGQHPHKDDEQVRELELPMIREFTTHILQTIHFL